MVATVLVYANSLQRCDHRKTNEAVYLKINGWESEDFVGQYLEHDICNMNITDVELTRNPKPALRVAEHGYSEEIEKCHASDGRDDQPLNQTVPSLWIHFSKLS